MEPGYESITFVRFFFKKRMRKKIDLFSFFIQNHSVKFRLSSFVFILPLLFSYSCGEDFSSLEERAILADHSGSGPVVIFDPDARPIPRLPFPNDVLTRKASSTKTGRILNLPISTLTRFEKNLRENLNELDGFGNFSPISISFDRDPDIEKFYRDFKNNAPLYRPVIVVNINEGSPNYGVPVDFDVEIDDRFSLYPTMRPHYDFFPNDPLSSWDNLVLRENNILKIDGEEHLINFYDFNTHTLRLKPLVPYDEGGKYAVIIKKSLTDSEGNPIRPPQRYKYAHDLSQTDDVRKALDLLHIDKKDVAFAWTFTTQTVVDEMIELREGLYGRGKMAGLKAKYPPEVFIDDIDLTCDDGISYTLSASFIGEKFYKIINSLPENVIGQLKGSLRDQLNFESVDYFVFGHYYSPYFISGEKETFKKRSDGTFEEKPQRVNFLLAIPKPSNAQTYYKEFSNVITQPPYPVVIFGHGYSGSRFHALIYANIFARWGLATITIDAAGHGPDIPLAYIGGPPDALKEIARKELGIPPGFVLLVLSIFAKEFCYEIDEELIDPDRFDEFMKKFQSFGLIRELTQVGRAPDVNGDGVKDSGGDFFTADVFKTRDMIRQTVIDEMNLVRILREKGIDVDGDGKLEVGGPERNIYYTGQSMGGILGAVFAGVEKDVQDFVLNVPGGALIEIMLRTSLTSVAQRIFDELMGPVFVGGKVVKDGREIYPVTLNNNEREGEFAEENYLGFLKVEEGERVVALNTVNGEMRETIAGENGKFFLPLPSDPGDIVKIYRALSPSEPLTVKLGGRTKGLAIQRNTFDFVRFADIAATAIDRAEPLNYAVHYNNYSSEWRKNVLLPDFPQRFVLIQIALGDTTVPMNTGVALARSAGILTSERQKYLIEKGILYGLSDSYLNVDFAGEIKIEDPVVGSGVRFHLGGRKKGPHEYYAIPGYDEDTGSDGLFNEKEGNYSSENKDPHGDDYCPLSNEGGTERNGILDENEDLNGNGILEVNYTVLAQNQAGYFFTHGPDSKGVILDGIDNEKGGTSREELLILTPPYCLLEE